MVRGVVSAENVADEFARADMLLFVRGAITLQAGARFGRRLRAADRGLSRERKRRCSRRGGNRMGAVAG